jgi:thiosulfate/3-mercaptopyruvate sulfurtransferase
VLDSSFKQPGITPTARQDYDSGHIPGAVFFDIDAIADHANPLPHMLPKPEAFAKAAGLLGLTRGSGVVVYDGQGVFSAPRVWWSLRAMGYRDVSVLDGGLPAWIAEGRPLETGSHKPRSVPAMETRFEPELVRDLDQVRAALTEGTAQVLDARPAARFRGEAPEPRPGLRGGHMPGACSLPSVSVLGPDGRMKPKAELAEAFAQAGVDLEKPVITTCGSGVSAATLALALAVLGHDRAAVYDGSWTEWGGRDDTPVATGE